MRTQESRPANLDDLLEDDELEERMSDEGSLAIALQDPELIPDWHTQQQEQAR